MLLKQDDLKTFESYKKAMQASAKQIKENTKFCLFDEVHLPDASGKTRVLKPFLVIGGGQAQYKPLLGHLKGGRRFLTEGLCGLEDNKVTLNAKKVPFNKLRQQANLLKEIMGKHLLIPKGIPEVDEDDEETPAAPPNPLAAVPRPPIANPAANILKPPQPPGRPPAPPAPPGPMAAKIVPPATAVKPAPMAAAAKPVPPAPPTPPKHSEPHHVRLARASTSWHGTRSIVHGTCQQLKAAIRSHYGKSHPEVLKAIDGNMHKIDALTANLDHKLADSLKKASVARSEAERALELRTARGILNEYIRYVKSEPLIAHIDRNPFGVKCNLRQVLASSLTEMVDSLTA